MSVFTEGQWIDWVDRLSEDDFVVIDDFISEELFQSIRKFFLHQWNNEEFKKAGIGAENQYMIQTQIRGDFVYWLEPSRDQELASFFEQINELKGVLNRFCFLSLSGYEFHLAHYPKGNRYAKHLDQFENRNNRLVSVVLYLNEGWKKGDGGELKIYRDSGDILVEPIGKRVVIFKSDTVEHEVIETNVSRYSLTGWMLYQPGVLGSFLA